MGKNNYTFKKFSNLPQNINQKNDKNEITLHMLTAALQSTLLYRIVKNESYPLIIWHASTVRWWA